MEKVNILFAEMTLSLNCSKVGFLDINEIAAKQTTEEFTSEFGSGSCIFFNCDVTESDRLKGEFIAKELFKHN